MSGSGKTYLVRSGDYAEISVNTTGTEQTGIGTSFVKINQFDTNVISKISIADAANDKLICGETDEFILQCHLSFTGSNNATYTFAVFVAGVEQEAAHTEVKIGTGIDTQSVSFVGFAACARDDEIDVRVKADAASKVLTVKHGALSMEDLF